MKHLSALLIAVVLVLGCGDDKRGSKYDKLTDSQKGQFNLLVASTENSVDAAYGSNPTGRAFAALSNVKSRKTPAQEKVQKEMREKLNDAECSKEMTDPAEVGIDKIALQPGSKGQWYFKFTGDKCPINMSSTFGWQLTQETGEFTFAANYAIKDTGYASLNDVTGFDLSGKIGLSGNQESFQLVGNIQGNIQSTQFKTVGVVVTADWKGNQNNMETLTVMELKFPDFTAELKLISEGNPQDQGKMEVYLNGEKIEANQVKGLLRLL